MSSIERGYRQNVTTLTEWPLCRLADLYSCWYNLLGPLGIGSDCKKDYCSGILFDSQMADFTGEDMKGTEVNEFALTFYETTELFDYGSEKDDVLQYIKGRKGGRGGSFKMVMKDGKLKPFLGKIFEKKENINGYEFVPEEVTSSQQGK
jgi:hypothetical protein